MATFTKKATGNENAIEGLAVDGRGVVGNSETDYGIRAHSNKSSGIRSSSVEGRGIEGQSKNSDGVVGNSEGAGAGVIGVSNSGIGVHGKSTGGRGVVAESDTNYGLRATSQISAGIRGSSVLGRGVEGQSTNSDGVVGNSEGAGAGVIGVSKSGIGVSGICDTGVGVWGISATHEGVHAETQSTVTAAIAAYQKNPASGSAALYAKHEGDGPAAVFVGDILLTGKISFVNAADCAEDFDISAKSLAEPGTVMSMDDEGNLQESFHSYDKRVAGVVSGAGDYKPGLILDKQQSQSTRKPIALLGKVFCKVDAQFGPIEVGDLLTTSPTVGHAMRADDPFKAFGSVIGKALRPLAEGQGLIPILIALQ